MELFVEDKSIVRKIWGKSDTVLFIFTGAAAEFALNKAVDWLYHTGKLPSDPLGRLFSTVQYARQIIFSSKDEALKSIDTIKLIHSKVEESRGSVIPDWAYRDVLFMLIHYSVASFELLERKLTDDEKEEVYMIFLKVGTRMGLSTLPQDYKSWLPIREKHLNENIELSCFTIDLFNQYKKHLGFLRFKLMIESQKMLVPVQVKTLMHINRFSLLPIIIPIYKMSKAVNLDQLFKNALVPSKYKRQINELDINN